MAGRVAAVHTLQSLPFGESPNATFFFCFYNVSEAMSVPVTFNTSPTPPFLPLCPCLTHWLFTIIGDIPCELGQLVNLKVLKLNGNELEGEPCPPVILRSPRLRRAFVSRASWRRNRRCGVCIKLEVPR